MSKDRDEIKEERLSIRLPQGSKRILMDKANKCGWNLTTYCMQQLFINSGGAKDNIFFLLMYVKIVDVLTKMEEKCLDVSELQEEIEELWSYL